MRKVILLGDERIGKSAFLSAVHSCSLNLSPRNSPERYSPTIQDSLHIHGFQNTLFLDTSGSPDFDRLRPNSYDSVTDTILCFSLDSLVSFDQILEKWGPEVDYLIPDCTIHLLGFFRGISRTITYEQGLALSIQINALQYHECSLLNQNECHSTMQNIIDSSILNHAYLSQPLSQTYGEHTDKSKFISSTGHSHTKYSSFQVLERSEFEREYDSTSEIMKDGLPIQMVSNSNSNLTLVTHSDQVSSSSPLDPNQVIGAQISVVEGSTPDTSVSTDEIIVRDKKRRQKSKIGWASLFQFGDGSGDNGTLGGSVSSKGSQRKLKPEIKTTTTTTVAKRGFLGLLFG